MLDADVPAILVDPIQFEQVLLNLSINARDAMHNVGDIEVSTGVADVNETVCASCRQRVSGIFVELAVRNSGAGIPIHIIEHMFEPFYTTKDVGKGSGMGLAMVHGIVHDHGGHILVDSELGEGTTMRVVFPPLDADSAPPREESGSHPVVSRNAELKGRVLVAEDEAAMRSYSRPAYRLGPRRHARRNGSGSLGLVPRGCSVLRPGADGPHDARDRRRRARPGGDAASARNACALAPGFRR